MSNMSYCRFENTNRDLDDCAGSLEDFLYGDETISEGEQKYAARLVENCIRILQTFADHQALTIGMLIDQSESKSGGIEEYVLDILSEVDKSDQ